MIPPVFFLAWALKLPPPDTAFTALDIVYYFEDTDLDRDFIDNRRPNFGHVSWALQHCGTQLFENRVLQIHPDFVMESQAQMADASGRAYMSRGELGTLVQKVPALNQVLDLGLATSWEPCLGGASFDPYSETQNYHNDSVPSFVLTDSHGSTWIGTHFDGYSIVFRARFPANILQLLSTNVDLAALLVLLAFAALRIVMTEFRLYALHLCSKCCDRNGRRSNTSPHSNTSPITAATSYLKFFWYFFCCCYLYANLCVNFMARDNVNSYDSERIFNGYYLATIAHASALFRPALIGIWDSVLLKILSQEDDSLKKLCSESCVGQRIFSCVSVIPRMVRITTAGLFLTQLMSCLPLLINVPFNPAFGFILCEVIGLSGLTCALCVVAMVITIMTVAMVTDQTELNFAEHVSPILAIVMSMLATLQMYWRYGIRGAVPSIEMPPLDIFPRSFFACDFSIEMPSPAIVLPGFPVMYFQGFPKFDFSIQDTQRLHDLLWATIVGIPLLMNTLSWVMSWSPWSDRSDGRVMDDLEIEPGANPTAVTVGSRIQVDPCIDEHPQNIDSDVNKEQSQETNRGAKRLVDLEPGQGTIESKSSSQSAKTLVERLYSCLANGEERQKQLVEKTHYVVCVPDADMTDLFDQWQLIYRDMRPIRLSFYRRRDRGTSMCIKL